MLHLPTLRLVCALIVLAVAAPTATAENPVITVPIVDPAGPEGAIAGAQAAATSFATDATATAAGIPGTVVSTCPAPEVPPTAQTPCGVTVVADEVLVLFARAGVFSDEVQAAAGGFAAGVPAQADAILDTKLQEADAGAAAVTGGIVPGAGALLVVVEKGFQEHFCAFGDVPGLVPDAEGEGPALPDCGADSVLGNTLGLVRTAYGGTQGILLEVDAGPTCTALNPLVAVLTGAPLDCDALPDGGAVVAILPAALV